MNKKILFLVLFAAVLSFPYMVQALAPTGAASGSAGGMIEAIKSALYTIGGTIVVIGWVIAGILWLISAGSPEKTGIAKKATIAAVIGTVLIILSTISWNVINDLLGNPTTTP